MRGSTTAGGGGGGSGDQLAVFGVEGSLVAAAGAARLPFPVDATILGVSAAVNTAPAGADLIVDVNLNGTTIYSTQANRPTIEDAGNAADETTPDTTTIAAGDYLTVDVDQVGSSVAGSDLTVVVRYRVDA
jgi:hypothetical protein